MICAVILAAGQSRRMGTQKLLLPFAGSTVIARVVSEVLRGCIDRVFVVTGQDSDAVRQTLQGRPATLVRNPASDAEMLDSVRCGLRALPADCEAALVALGDQPGISAAVVDDVCAAHQASGKGIAVACHAGRRGHPVLLAARYWPEVFVEHDEIGLRGLLHAHPDDVCEVAVATPAVLSDMDFPEDYRRELARLTGDLPR